MPLRRVCISPPYLNVGGDRGSEEDSSGISEIHKFPAQAQLHRDRVQCFVSVNRS